MRCDNGGLCSSWPLAHSDVATFVAGSSTRDPSNGEHWFEKLTLCARKIIRGCRKQKSVEQSRRAGKQQPSPAAPKAARSSSLDLIRTFLTSLVERYCRCNRALGVAGGRSAAEPFPDASQNRGRRSRSGNRFARRNPRSND